MKNFVAIYHAPASAMAAMATATDEDKAASMAHGWLERTT